MMKTLLRKRLNDRLFRVQVAAYACAIPLVVGTCWNCASFFEAAWHLEFWPTFIQLILGSMLTGGLFGPIMLYGVERFIIRGRASTNPRYMLLRTGLFVLMAFPIGFIASRSVAIVIGTFPESLSSIFYVTGIIVTLFISVALGFLERMVEEMRTREEHYEKQISALKFEIDEAKRQKDVREIVESDSFNDLKAKAQAIKARNSTRSGNTKTLTESEVSQG